METRRSRPGSIVFAVCFGLAAYGFWRILAPSLTPLVWAAVFATVCYPVYTILTRWLHDHRRLAALLTCLLISILIVLPAVFLVMALAKQSAEASSAVQQFVLAPEFDEQVQALQAQATDRVARAFGGAVDLSGLDIRTLLLDFLRRVSQMFVAASSSLVTGFAGFLFSFFLMIVALFFFFVDGRHLIEQGKQLIPLRPRHADALLNQFHEVSVATLVGTLLTGLSQGTMGALVFLILGLPAPVFWGTVMGSAAFIPFVGAGLVWVPAAIYLLVTGSVAKGVSLFALGALVISSVDNLVRTFVMRDRMRMHILLLFLSLIGGVKTFGLVGIVLGPLIAALFQTFFAIYKMEFRKELA